MTRPCWFIGISLLIGCLAGAWLPTNMLLIAAVGSVIVTIVCVATPSFRCRRGLFFSCFGVCVSLMVLCALQFGQYLPLSRRVGDTVSFTAKVLESERGVYLTVTQGELPKGTHLQLWSYDDSLSIEPYDVVEGTFTLCDYEEEGLAKLRRKAGGIWFAARAETITVAEGTQPWTGVFTALRHRAVKRIEAHLSGDIAALVAGVCFGEDTTLSEQAENAFRACGISHLFSVSGFHMALLSQALLWLLERFRVSRYLRASIAVIAVLFFMMLVGTEASVIRSGVLCLLMLIAGCFRRQADTRNSLGLALILLLIADPFAAYDAGLLLSFFATFGLVIVCPWLAERAKLLISQTVREEHPRFSTLYDAVVNGVCLTLSATFATAPIAILFFGELSVVSVLSNLLVSLPSSALLIVGMAGCVCTVPVLNLFAPLFFFCAGHIAQYLLWISEKISNFPLVTVAITAPYLLLWIAGMTILPVIGYRFARRQGLAIVAAVGAVTLLIAVTANTFLMRGVTSITAVPTKGDTTVYMQSGEYTVLVCAPTRINTLYQMRTALRLDGVRKLDALIVLGGDESVLLNIPLFLENYLTDKTVLYHPSATALSDHFALACPLSEEMVSLREDMLFRFYGRHACISVGQTDVLFLPDASAIHALPKDVWVSELIVFGDEVPQDALFLQAQWGVAQGEPYVLPSAASCGVEHLFPMKGNRFTILTRGAGDITKGDYG